MGSLEKEDTSSVPTIPEYFKNKNILITGGSGFMGQVLVEKLLYSCPELHRIYLLMRTKRGVLPENRLEKLYSSSCFDRLRKDKPTIFYEKVHIIAGNVLDLGLDLSEEDRALLIENVNIVFHAAASVRFDDPLSYAVKLNLRGTREVIALAKEMRNLSSFIHVSTAYSNCKYEVIDEVLRPPLADWREVLEVCEAVDEDTLRILTPKYLNGMPNTYVFTKHLAEHLVNEERGRLPVVIIRPSVVTASKAEPAPGWMLNLNGPGALFIAVGKGVKYSIYGDVDTFINYIPVDVCIRNFIVTAWAVGTNRFRLTDNLHIFNCVSNQHDMLTMLDVAKRSIELHRKWPFEEVLWCPKLPVVTNSFIRHYLILLSVDLTSDLHFGRNIESKAKTTAKQHGILSKIMCCCVLPAVMVDFVFKILGKKPRLLKIQRAVYSADIALSYFLLKNWEFVNKKFLEIRQLLKEEDIKYFYYKIEELFVNDSYIEMSLRGGKKYVMNEDVNDLTVARKVQFRMKVLDLVCRITFYGGILWIIFSKFVTKFI